MHDAHDQGAVPAVTDTPPDRDDPGSSAKGDVPPSSACHPDADNNLIELETTLLCATDTATLRAAITAAIPNVHRPVSRIGVQVVDDASMTALHTQWHNLDTTTDVLTFEEDTTGPIDVDIAVCADEARRQAASRGHAVIDELVLYVLHGLLHCCGHDDKTPQAQARMFAAQDELLRAIGRAPISEDVS